MNRHPYFDLARPIVLGHRGCAGEVPENTLPSFERALLQGAAILETDVHITRDGVPVLIHDPTVDRTTDGGGAVREMTFDELRELDAGFSFSSDGGSSFPYRGRALRIPSLAEALAALPGVRFNLELKQTLPGFVDSVSSVIRSAGREPTTLLAAADDSLMETIRREIARTGASVAVGASAGDVQAFVSSMLEGRTPPSELDVLQVPVEFGGVPLVTSAFVGHAHAHGIQVHAWTVDEPQQMHGLLDLEVDGLVTNYPAKMLAVIEERRGTR